MNVRVVGIAVVFAIAALGAPSRSGAEPLSLPAWEPLALTSSASSGAAFREAGGTWMRPLPTSQI